MGKKILLVAGGAVLGVALAFGCFYLWNYYQVKQLSKRQPNYYEIPESIDYRNMNADQQEELFKSVSKVYPSRVTDPQAYPELEEVDEKKKSKGKDFPLIREIVFTSDEKPIADGIALAPPDAVVDFTNADELVPSVPAEVPEQPVPEQPAPDQAGDQGQDDSEIPPAPEEPVGTIIATKNTWDGNLGGLDGADMKCQIKAEDEGLGGVWKAMLPSYKDGNRVWIKDRVPNGVKFVNILGHQIAKNKDDLFDGSITNPILFPDGNLGGGLTWTGSDTQAKGQMNITHANQNLDMCGNWTCSKAQHPTNPVEGCTGSVGYPNKLDKEWQYVSEIGCDHELHLYCVKTVMSLGGRTPPGDGSWEGDLQDPWTDEGSREAPEEPFERESKLAGFTIKYFGYSWGGHSDPALDGKLRQIKTAVEKYYPEIVEIYGRPYNRDSRTLTILYNSVADDSHPPFIYNSQFDVIAIPEINDSLIITSLVYAFHGRYAQRIPESWQYGMSYAAADLVMRNYPEVREGTLFDRRKDDLEYYEMYNVKNYPIIGNRIEYLGSDWVLGYYTREKRTALAAMAFLKPYYGKDSFFKDFNEKIYSVPYNSGKWNNDEVVLADMTSSFQTVEGEPIKDWYQKQYVLHQADRSPLYMFILGRGTEYFLTQNKFMETYQYRVELDGGNAKFLPKAGNCLLNIQDDRGNNVSLDHELIDCQAVEDGIKRIAFWDSDQLERKARYMVHNYVVGYGTVFHDYAYAGEVMENKLYGVVKNFGEGTIEASLYRNGEELGSTEVNKGYFAFNEAMEGYIVLKVKDKDGNVVLERHLSKEPGSYFAVLDSPVSSYAAQSGTRGSSEAPPAPQADCAEGWKEFTDKDGNYKLKYPYGWANLGQVDNSYGPGWSYHGAGKHYVDKEYTSTILTLSSSDDFMKMADRSNKINAFDIVTSADDPKKNENYMDWFSNHTGLMKEEKTTFKGIPGELYTEEVDMPGGRFRRNIYSFQSGGLYYLLSLGIYVDPEVKEENEAMLKCFLDNFEVVSSQEPVGEEVPADLIACTSELLNMDSSDCAELPSDPICGYERMYYPDVGKSGINKGESPNPCMFCSYFDENGYRGLRGTKIYVLGYTKGDCPK